ncbi:MAG: VOC family protein [Deltaproteobacteria bacterium]|nr:VOC family protein [Deltaproteobacteria bacterium]
MNHFAWEVASLDELKKAKGLLEARGIPILWSGQHGPGNNKGIYFTDPEGNVVELYCDLDQIGWDGRSRPSEQWNRREGLDDL